MNLGCAEFLAMQPRRERIAQQRVFGGGFRRLDLSGGTDGSPRDVAGNSSAGANRCTGLLVEAHSDKDENGDMSQ